MKISSRFHILIFFTSMLTFSMPFVSIAQQHSVMLETKTDAETQNANAVALAAKTAAEQDASRDTNKILWFGVGFAISTTISPVGLCLGCCAGGLIDSNYNGTGQRVGLLTGLAVGTLTPLISIYSYPPHPPPQRLIGKSPEYVEYYTEAYKRKMRSLQTKFALAGTATGCGLMILGCLVSSY